MFSYKRLNTWPHVVFLNHKNYCNSKQTLAKQPLISGNLTNWNVKKQLTLLFFSSWLNAQLSCFPVSSSLRIIYIIISLFIWFGSISRKMGQRLRKLRIETDVNWLQKQIVFLVARLSSNRFRTKTRKLAIIESNCVQSSRHEEVFMLSVFVH